MTIRASSKELVSLAGGLAAWWLFMWWAFMPGAAVYAAILLGFASGFCFLVRDKKTGFVLWFPITAAVSLLFIVLLPTWCLEAGRLNGNPAPLAGVAIIYGLAILVVAGGVLVICYVARPRRYPPLVCWITVLNTLVIGCVSYAWYDHNTSREVVIRFIDSKGEAIPGVEIADSGGGTRVSREAGKFIKRVRDGRDLEISARKPGFEEVKIKVSAQFSKWQTERDVTVEMRGRVSANSWVPASDPVEFMVYLAKPSEIEGETDLRELSTKFPTEGGKRNLDLAGDRFTDSQEADIRFEFFAEKDEQGYLRSRLRLIAMNGAGVLQVPYFIRLVDPPASFEKAMKIAPAKGYEESTVLMEPGSSPGPMIYVRARDGKTYARLAVDGWKNPRMPDEPGRIRLKMLKTTASTRALLESKSKYF